MKENVGAKKLLDEIIHKKNILRDGFEESPDRVFEFYKSLKNLSELQFSVIDSLKKIFPSPPSVLEQGIFDATSEILAGSSVEECVGASLSIFKKDYTEKIDPVLFKKDMRLLQAVFFFFLRDLYEANGASFLLCKSKEALKKEIDELFDFALKEKRWFLPETQTKILNKISSGINFCKDAPFTDTDFAELKGNKLEANESILRLLANFMNMEKVSFQKEKLISEMNFVREQQKLILQVYPNSRKADYSESAAEKEIKKSKANLQKLHALDFGFVDSDFTQILFANDKKNKRKMKRKITCKFFKEAELKWSREPETKELPDGRRKIFVKKDERHLNKCALECKFLYPERNGIVHVSENFAVYNLFVKGYNGHRCGSYWENLVLYALYDSHEYLLSLLQSEQKENAEKLLVILNHYLERISTKLNLNARESFWTQIFDEDGFIRRNDVLETNIYSVLEEHEVNHFRKFMSFLYLSHNEEKDFFESQFFAIQMYLIYLTFEFAKMDG